MLYWKGMKNFLTLESIVLILINCKILMLIFSVYFCKMVTKNVLFLMKVPTQ